MHIFSISNLFFLDGIERLKQIVWGVAPVVLVLFFASPAAGQSDWSESFTDQVDSMEGLPESQKHEINNIILAISQGHPQLDGDKLQNGPNQFSSYLSRRVAWAVEMEDEAAFSVIQSEIEWAVLNFVNMPAISEQDRIIARNRLNQLIAVGDSWATEAYENDAAGLQQQVRDVFREEAERMYGEAIGNYFRPQALYLEEDWPGAGSLRQVLESPRAQQDRQERIARMHAQLAAAGDVPDDVRDAIIARAIRPEARSVRKAIWEVLREGFTMDPAREFYTPMPTELQELSNILEKSRHAQAQEEVQSLVERAQRRAVLLEMLGAGARIENGVVVIEDELSILTEDFSRDSSQTGDNTLDSEVIEANSSSTVAEASLETHGGNSRILFILAGIMIVAGAVLAIYVKHMKTSGQGL